MTRRVAIRQIVRRKAHQLGLYDMDDVGAAENAALVAYTSGETAWRAVQRGVAFAADAADRRREE